jgi:hypothetical protein
VQDRDQLRERVSGLVRSSGDPDTARKKLAELLVADPPSFRAAALQVLPGLGDPSSRRGLLDLMLKAGLLPVCDPALIGLDEELALTRDLLELDPQLDMTLARRLSGASSAGEEVVQRVLVLLNAIPENARILPMVVKLLRHESPNVRSKAALVIGRASKTPQVMKGFLSESDSRVRANAIEALWGIDSASARAVLREAADDPSNRVVGNALLGLYRLGETTAVPRILQMAAHPQAAVRTTAAWVMEQTGSPRFLPVLAQMVRESNPTARAWVFRAINKLKRTASGAARLPRLRVHLTGASFPAGKPRTLLAVIATEDGREIPSLPATSILLWEDSRTVVDYRVRPLGRPDSLRLGLALPLGDTGDRARTALTRLKRGQDRWQECRYADAGAAFTFLETLSGGRHMIVVAPPLGDPTEVAQWGLVLARARSTAVSVQVITVSSEDPNKVALECEKAYLMLLCGYEVTTPGTAAADPAELKLEVYSGLGYGVDVLKLP